VTESEGDIVDADADEDAESTWPGRTPDALPRVAAESAERTAGAGA
jgi:hypothetical protein